MRIALLPLDERPVNVRLPAQVAAVAGADVVVPAVAALPRMRAPGDVGALGDWLTERCLDRATDAGVVSLEMLHHGGLIASRLSTADLSTVLDRDRPLRTVRAARPHLPLSAVTVVMRASDSYVADEEPGYWSEHGRELHALGGALHREFLGEPTTAGRDVPPTVRADFVRRRLRNHVTNLAALELVGDGTVAPLLVTADDTASRSAGSLEQTWIDHWTRALVLPSDSVLAHPGADEVAAVLVARALEVLHPAPVRMRVVCGEPGGLARVPLYENQPVGRGVASQVRASGSVLVDDAADAVVVLHAPDTAGGDWRARVPAASDPQAVTVTVRAVVAALDSGAAVGLADTRYANGADPELVEQLRQRGLLGDLAAYGGWNTAGNTIGSVVAALRARVIGQRAGTYDGVAGRRLLLGRLLEDWGYQALVRTRLTGDLDPQAGQDAAHGELADAYLASARGQLEALLPQLEPEARLADTNLPWHRSFEIDLDVTVPATLSMDASAGVPASTSLPTSIRTSTEA